MFKVTYKLDLASRTAVDIEKTRDGYRPAAMRGAILFFVLADMSVVNSMYHYSLESFLEVFVHSLKRSLPDTILRKRLNNITEALTLNVYNYGCTGETSDLSNYPLVKMFVLSICHSVGKSSGLRVVIVHLHASF